MLTLVDSCRNNRNLPDRRQTTSQWLRGSLRPTCRGTVAMALLLLGVSCQVPRTARAELPILPGFERWRSDLTKGAGVVYCSPDGIPETFIENPNTPESNCIHRMTDFEMVWPDGSKEPAYAISFVERQPDDPPQLLFAGAGPEFMEYLQEGPPEGEEEDFYRPLDFDIRLNGFSKSGEPEFVVYGIAVLNTGKQYAPSWEFQSPVGQLVFFQWLESLHQENKRLLDFEITQVGPEPGDLVYSGVAVQQTYNDLDNPDETSIEWMHDWFNEGELVELAGMGWIPVDVELRPENALDVTFWPYEGIFVRDPNSDFSFEPELPSYELWKYEYLLPVHVTDLEFTGNYFNIPKLPEPGIFGEKFIQFFIDLFGEDFEQAGGWSGNVMDFSGKEAGFLSVFLIEP